MVGRLTMPNITARSAGVSFIPDWEVANLKVSDSCKSLFDYCIKVSCDVTGKGSDPESGTIVIWLKQGGKELQHNAALHIGGTQVQSLQHAFKEAKLFGNQPVGGCRVERKGSRVTCELNNDGGSGQAQVRYTLTDVASGKTRTHVETVDVRGGERLVRGHVFDAFGLTDVEKGIRGGCKVIQ